MVIQFQLTTGFSEAHLLPMDFNKPAIPPVLGLLRHCSPSAIIRRIPLVIIKTLYGMLARWLHAHVGQEQFKLLPSVANRNTALNVIRSVVPVHVGASRLHVLPTPILATVSIPCSVPMLGHSFQELLYNLTSTASRCTVYKTAIGNRFFIPAITSANPSPSVGVLQRLTSQNCEHSEPLANLVDTLHHSENVSYSSKLYKCPYGCGVMLPHDKMHNHVMHICPKRPGYSASSRNAGKMR